MKFLELNPKPVVDIMGCGNKGCPSVKLKEYR